MPQHTPPMMEAGCATHHTPKRVSDFPSLRSDGACSDLPPFLVQSEAQTDPPEGPHEYRQYDFLKQRVFRSNQEECMESKIVERTTLAPASLGSKHPVIDPAQWMPKAKSVIQLLKQRWMQADGPLNTIIPRRDKSWRSQNALVIRSMNCRPI